MCLYGFWDRLAGCWGCPKAVLCIIKKLGRNCPKSVLPEGAVGMGMRSALGGSPLAWLDLGCPKDVRGYTDCPLEGPDLDLRVGNAKLTTSFVEYFRVFCVSLKVHLKG